jgi:hypothetical protein
MPRHTPFLLIAAAALAACGESPTGRGAPAMVEFVTTDATATPGWILDDSLEVRVTSSNGTPLAGVTVEWSTGASSVTGSDGIARAEYVPGWARGTQTVTATVGTHTASLDVQVGSMELIATEVLDRRVCGLDTDGRMWCWPEYSHDPEHPMHLDDARRPLPVETTLRFVALRSYGYGYGETGLMCAITAAGEVWCADEDDFTGPHESTSSVPTLQQLSTPAPVADLAIGQSSSSSNLNMCMLDTDGFAWCRGPNLYGQLGNGTTTDSDSWQQVQGGLRFDEITVGDRDACAIALNGQPYCWGGNANSRLGITPAAFSVPVPTPVDGDLRLKRITQASGGLCGIAAFGDPDLVCWGPTFPADRVDPDEPSGIQGLPLTAASLAGDWAGGRITHDGRLYRFGYNGGWIADFQYNDLGPYPLLEPTMTDIDRLVSRTSYYWCVRHVSGSTICSTVNDIPVAVPLPE